MKKSVNISFPALPPPERTCFPNLELAFLFAIGTGAKGWRPSERFTSTSQWVPKPRHPWPRTGPARRAPNGVGSWALTVRCSMCLMMEEAATEEAEEAGTSSIPQKRLPRSSWRPPQTRKRWLPPQTRTSQRRPRRRQSSGTRLRPPTKPASGLMPCRAPLCNAHRPRARAWAPPSSSSYS